MSGNFIYEGFVNLELCDKLIDHHKKSNKKFDGAFSNKHIVDKRVKDSIDVVLYYGEELYNEYCTELQVVLDSYVQNYPSCKYYSPFKTTPANIQHYAPGGGFKIWHTERASKVLPNSSRHLVFMTYLNDVTDGGGTEFLNQNITVDARKGKTLIWPADWTHTHRGIVSPTQNKYIITGWFNFIK